MFSPYTRETAARGILIESATESQSALGAHDPGWMITLTL